MPRSIWRGRRASVVYDDDRLSPVEVADKVRDLGYDVVTEKAELDIAA